MFYKVFLQLLVKKVKSMFCEEVAHNMHLLISLLENVYKQGIWKQYKKLEVKLARM